MCFFFLMPFSLFSQLFHIFWHFHFVFVFPYLSYFRDVYWKYSSPYFQWIPYPIKHTHTHTIWIWTAPLKIPLMREAVCCPVCVQNVRNSGRNNCDHHALPLSFLLARSPVGWEDRGRERQTSGTHYYGNPDLEWGALP